MIRLKTLLLEQTKSVTNKVAAEGLKNITPNMISSPPFIGTYSASTLTGNFGGTDYTWIFDGVNGVPGLRGQVTGQVGTGMIEDAFNTMPEDAKPNTPVLQFLGKNGFSFSVYITNTGKAKGVY